MTSLKRRKLLASLGPPAAALVAGCEACALSGDNYDDLLRVDVREFRGDGDSFQGEARVRHRGPNGAEEPQPGRTEYYTNYEGVSFLGYTHDRRKVLEIPMGDFEPGTSVRRAFETESVPMVVTATADAVSFDVACPNADTGARIGTYAGRYTSRDPFEAFNDNFRTPREFRDPRRSVTERLNETGTGHRWIPTGEFRHDADPPPALEAFERARCAQRQLEGRVRDGPPDMSALPAADDWLSRSETLRFEVYGSAGQAPRPNRRGRATDVPDRIVDVIRTTDWRSMDGVRKVTESVTHDEWRRMIATLEGAGEPTFPPCDADYVFCHPYQAPHDGRCQRGNVTAYYEFDPHSLTDGTPSGDDEEKLYWVDDSVVVMEYQWSGVQS